MKTIIIKPIKTEKEIKKTYPVIKQIWEEFFTPIIGEEQVRYMLNTYQSPHNILCEINSGTKYYALMLNHQIVGYTAYKVEEESLYLSKIYLLSSVRGKGYSSEIFEWYMSIAKKMGKQSIYLIVNKDNDLAISVYKRKGFILKDERVVSIGNGFEMSDYIFEKKFTL
ncbi:GNAT family N-acetyltransferase [Enterococcus faecalis]|uniref:GNAT family N-acetyltransferase n=1 Tax=Enterococcus faecalis TaxID=1351 RepID=UPI003D0F0A5B